MAHFWKSFQYAKGTQLMMSITFHPQTDGQSERTIQTLEDMLQACILNLKGSWEEHLPLVEFAYNNSYQESIQTTPYEALYGMITTQKVLFCVLFITSFEHFLCINQPN